MEPRDVISAIAGRTGAVGSAFYFQPSTMARGKELGLDGLRFYVLGRGGPLGDVEPDVVRSAFGYFAPALVDKMWNSARERLAPRRAAEEHLACNAAFGRDRLVDVEGLDAYCAAADQVIQASDVAGLTLFAALRTMPVPDDVPARAIHLSTVLRELRGSAHLIAVRSLGLRSEVAHAIERPDDVEMFGWSDPPPVSDDDRERFARAREVTDTILEPGFATLDADQGAALVAGTRAMYDAITSA